MAVKERKEGKLSKRSELAKQYFNPEGPKYNVKALCDALTLTRKEFQEYTGVAASNYWEDKFVSFNKEDLENRVSKLLLLEVLLEDLFPSKQEAQFWLRLPNTEFANASPLKTAIAGSVDQVIATLNALSEGNLVA